MFYALRRAGCRGIFAPHGLRCVCFIISECCDLLFLVGIPLLVCSVWLAARSVVVCPEIVWPSAICSGGGVTSVAPC